MDIRPQNQAVVSHPLEGDTGGIYVQAFMALLRLDPHGSLVQLVLENTPAAQTVMKAYRSHGERAVCNNLLFRSLLALTLIHCSGYTYKLYEGEAVHNQINLQNLYNPQDQAQLHQIVVDIYNKDLVKKMLAVYGLDEYEHLSIQAYSLPHKADKVFMGKDNPYYMFDAPHWGKYKNGWESR